jgi:CDP-diglyceride synthetase
MWESGDAFSAAYFTAVLGLAEIGRRRLRLAPDVSRKVSLGSLGLWSVPAVHLYSTPERAALPFLLLAVALYLSFRFDLLASVEDDGAGFGSVLGPLSAAALLALVPSDRVYVAVSGILASSVGDTTAALVGRRLGSKRYRVLGHPRTMEGTLALFLAASAVQAVTLATMGNLDVHQAVAFALIAGTVAAVVEMASVYGSDNLTVPFASALTLLALLGAVQ